MARRPRDLRGGFVALNRAPSGRSCLPCPWADAIHTRTGVNSLELRFGPPSLGRRVACVSRLHRRATSPGAGPQPPAARCEASHRVRTRSETAARCPGSDWRRRPWLHPARASFETDPPRIPLGPAGRRLIHRIRAGLSVPGRRCHLAPEQPRSAPPATHPRIVAARAGAS
jgi:hypothetical protein